MKRIYSINSKLSYENLPENAQYCSVTAFNTVKCAISDIKSGKLLPKSSFEFCKRCIESGNTSLIEKQDHDVLASSCDKNGLRLLDHAIISGNYDFVRFLVENTTVEINTIPFGLKETAIHFVLDSLSPSLDKKLVEHAKIVSYLLREGAFAYTLEDFTYDDVYASERGLDDFDCKQENVLMATICAVDEFLINCVNELGASTVTDEKLLTAIDIYARSGFMPTREMIENANFRKYNLGYLFDLEERGITVSHQMALAMKLFNGAYEDYFLNDLDKHIKNANIIAGTYASVTYSENDFVDEDDYDGEVGDVITDVSNNISANEFQIGVENLVDKCQQGISYEEYQQELENLGKIIGLEGEEVKAYFENEFGDNYFAPVDEKTLDKLKDAIPMSDEELELEDMDADELIDLAIGEIDKVLEILDEDEQESEYKKDNYEIIPRFNIYELIEIAKKNEKYLNESAVLKTLYSNPKRLSQFRVSVKNAVWCHDILQDVIKRDKYLNRILAERNDDNVDDMLDPLGTNDQPGDN